MTDTATNDNIEQLLANDNKVKVAVVDTDGLLRGKVMHKDKFLQIIADGFGKAQRVGVETYMY
jgi:glutamine synthetase